MRRKLAQHWGAVVTAAVAGALMAAPAALAQGYGAPEWAKVLLATDMQPTLTAPAGGLSARLTITQAEGGVARVIRYSSGEDGARIGLLRFTGHPRNGWSQWGPDAPVPIKPSAAAQAEIDRLLRAAVRSTAVMGESRMMAAPTCVTGVLAYLEIAEGSAQSAFERRCIAEGAAAAAIAEMSRVVGSEDEEALYVAGITELTEADKAFARLAQERGAPAAFARFVHEDAVIFVAGQEPFQGEAGVRQRFARWPAGTRLEWAPERAEVAARGDMGWTWGRGMVTAPDGRRTPTQYLTVWRRNEAGEWRFISDMGVEGPPVAPVIAPTPVPSAAPTPPAPRGGDLRR